MPLNANKRPDPDAPVAVCEDSQATTAASASIAARRRRQRWAELIGRVYEVDPLRCPHCGGRMKIIAFLEPRDQAPTIARILRHCGLCLPVRARTQTGTDPPPPTPKVPPARAEAVEPELLYVAEEGGVYRVPGARRRQFIPDLPQRGRSPCAGA